MYNKKCVGPKLATIEKDPNVDRIYNHILTCDPNREFTYIILGRPGPTGKTTLANDLSVFGYEAIEITEELLAVTQIDGIHNSFIVNKPKRYALVVLNRKVVW